MKKLSIFLLSFTVFFLSVFFLNTAYADNELNEKTSKGFWSVNNKPEFYGTTRIVIKKGEKFSLNDTRYRIFARDFEDLNISNKIQSSNNVDTSVPGDYKINYSVTDSH